jgi:hypothetical protein
LCVLVGQPYALELDFTHDRVALRNTALAERLLTVHNDSFGALV